MDRIFITDGPVWISAGMAAGIDLALGFIERDMGEDIARATARNMVVYHRRAGGKSQHSAMPELDAKSDRVQMALAYARQNLREPLRRRSAAETPVRSPWVLSCPVGEVEGDSVSDGGWFSTAHRPSWRSSSSGSG